MPAKAAFIEPMLLLRTEKLPQGPEWVYELKLDGYRAIAFKFSEARRFATFGKKPSELVADLAEVCHRKC